MSAEYSAEFIKPQSSDDKESLMGFHKRNKWVDSLRTDFARIKEQVKKPEVIMELGSLANSAGIVGTNQSYIELPDVEQGFQSDVS